MPNTLLPQEVQDLVIDALFHDRPTLAQSSLVSKTWHRRGRQLFFQNFDVVISIYKPEQQAKTDKLLEIVETGISTLPQYTQQLRIQGLGLEFNGESPKAADYRALEPYLCRALPFFVSVKDLEVESLHWNKLSAASHASFSCLSTVETLTLSHVTFTNWEAAYDIIYGQFWSQTISNLQLDSIYCEVTTPAPLPEEHHPTLQRLKSLAIVLWMWSHVRNPSLSHVLSAPCKLHTLDIVCADKHLDTVNEILQHIGTSLKVLKIQSLFSSSICSGYKLEEYKYDGVSRFPLSVASNTSLERLHIFEWRLRHWSYAVDFLPYFFSNTFDSVQSGHFEELIFRVQTGEQNMIDMFETPEAIGRCLGEPFSALDAVFAEKKSTIPKVRILLELWDEGASLSKWNHEIRRRVAVRAARAFPNLCRNGQLAITIHCNIIGYSYYFDFERIEAWGDVECEDEEEEEDSEPE